VTHHQEKIAAARQAMADGKVEIAARIAAAILEFSPDYLDALEIKALAEMAGGDDAAAEASLRKAISIAPSRRWPYGDLARLLLRLRRVDEAERVARAALASDADNADAQALLGSVLLERGAPFEAAVHLQAALKLAGPHPQLLTRLGLSLLRQGQLDEARPVLERAIVADANALKPVAYLAELEERLGRFAVSERLLDRAQQIAGISGTDVDLQRSVLLARMDCPEQALALLEQKKGLSGAALLQRGRLRDRLGRHADAWSDWIDGKVALAERGGRYYPTAEVKQQADRLAAFFTPNRVANVSRPSRRDGCAQPIFIIGFPRSGTTLTEQILASHSAIRAGGELPFGRELRDLAVELAAEETAFPEGLDRTEGGWPERLRDRYLERAKQYGLTDGGGWFTDKMPLNDMWLPLLRLAFPDSAVVLVRRHPLDVLVSVMAHDMTHGFHCAYRLEDAAVHLALMDKLIACYSQARIGPTYELQYERLVADQADVTRRLMASIGLEMEPSQLRFFEHETVSPTPSYAQVREPLNDRSIGRWRNYAEQLEPIMPVVAKAMERGGYAA
jgi:Tfp pilus assembly protein PilF